MKSVSACGIDPGAHGPEDVVHIVDVDIVVDHHDVAAEIGAGLALRGDHRGLLGVAGIALLDRDRGEESSLGSSRRRARRARRLCPYDPR